MMVERGVGVHHTTLWGWVQCSDAEIETRQHGGCYLSDLGRGTLNIPSPLTSRDSVFSLLYLTWHQ